MWNIIFLVTGAMFIALLFIIMFSKDAISSKEIKLFKTLIIINCLEYMTEIPLQLFVRKFGIDNVCVNLFAKLYFCAIFTWFSFFSIYTFIICLNKKEEAKFERDFSVIKKINLAIWIIGLFLMLFLPFGKFYNGEKMYVYGGAIDALKLLLGIYMFVWIVLLIKNIKNIKTKKYVPIFFVLLLLGLNTIIQTTIDPSILVASMIGTFICYIMYYTIENPDVKMINELNKNRTLINKTMEDKSNFLFLTASQIKNPIEEIIKLSDNSIELKKVLDLQENLKQISNMSHNLSILVNNVMDISSLSYSNIKTIPEKYNLKNLFAKIKLLEEKKVNEDIEFRFIINDNIPEYLNGDSKLLEQILISILENSIKYTKSGFIELRLNAIIKYDMARLIFTIEDSGLGMTIDKVNELLLVDTDLTSDELKRLETNNVNMNTIKKLVSKLGGYFTIKSEVNKGTEVKVVIDQMIPENNKINVNNYGENNKALIATNNKALAHKLSTKLLEFGYNTETSIYANDVIDRVRVGEEFEYILIDDNLDKRAIEVLKELQKKTKLKTKIIVILPKDMEMIKEQFINDGFNDYILIDNIDNDLKRVFE